MITGTSAYADVVTMGEDSVARDNRDKHSLDNPDNQLIRKIAKHNSAVNAMVTLTAGEV